MSYLQAIVIALVQGVTELFPVSSLGHSVLVPAWIGGSWQTLVTQSSAADGPTSFYLAFLVALHCATALALLWFFRADWVRVIAGFFRSVWRSVTHRRFSVESADERLAWMIVVATIPVGIAGLALQDTFRTLLAKPVASSLFLLVNGLILLGGEGLRRRGVARLVAGASEAPAAGGGRNQAQIDEARRVDARLSRLGPVNAGLIGVLQIGALCAGISRDGITMVGGLWRGLDREDAARFAFLLATPPILAAGLLKLPSLAGTAGEHIHGQVIVGAIVAGVSAYVSVRYLVRYFRTRSLIPFGIYCLAAGAASLAHFA